MDEVSVMVECGDNKTHKRQSRKNEEVTTNEMN
jgi:hypothetical protein